MKRFFLASICILIGIQLATGAFTEFYCRNSGSNVNSGSTSGAAAYTSTNGGWNGTNIFTPTDGSTPSSSVAVGDFCGIMVDGASSASAVKRVTAVGIGVNATVTLSSAASAGTPPSSGASGRTLVCGGAWKGPSGTDFFPHTLIGLGSLVNTSSDATRINFKNDQTYSTTASFTNGSSSLVLQGFGTSVGDGGKAIFSSNVTGAVNYVLTGTNMRFVDLIFVATGTTGSDDCVTSSGSGAAFVRVVFHGARGSGININGGSALLVECEAYDCNRSNTSGKAGFAAATTSPGTGAYYCYSHDHAAGTNADGFAVSGAMLRLDHCIVDSAGGNGVTGTTSITGGSLYVINSDFYNNTGDAVKIASANPQGFFIGRNNNFIKNGGKGINITVNGQTGLVDNNGYGAGTQANGSADSLKSVIDTGTSVTYPSNATPWNAPTTGDFSITLAQAEFAGRGAFVETGNSKTGTVGYPDIGAAQHSGVPGTPTPTPTPTASPTPTSTPATISHGSAN